MIPDFPDTTEIYDHMVRMRMCIQRTSDGRLPQASHEAWVALWNSHVKAGSTCNLGVRDTGMLCSWGWLLAMEQGQFEEAANRYAPWQAHPDKSPEDWPEWDHHHSEHAVALLYCGKVGEAMALYRAVLERTSGDHPRAAFLVACGSISGFLNAQPDDYKPPAVLEQVVRQASARIAPGLPPADQVVPLRRLFAVVKSHLQQHPDSECSTS